MRRVAFRLSAVLVAFCLASPALAWIYPEHRNIAGKAIEGLDPTRKAALERLWAEARKGHEDRLCEKPVGGRPGEEARVHRPRGVPRPRGRPLLFGRRHAQDRSRDEVGHGRRGGHGRPRPRAREREEQARGAEPSHVVQPRAPAQGPRIRDPRRLEQRPLPPDARHGRRGRVPQDEPQEGRRAERPRDLGALPPRGDAPRTRARGGPRARREEARGGPDRPRRGSVRRPLPRGCVRRGARDGDLGRRRDAPGDARLLQPDRLRRRDVERKADPHVRRREHQARRPRAGRGGGARELRRRSSTRRRPAGRVRPTPTRSPSTGRRPSRPSTCASP